MFSPQKQCIFQPNVKVEGPPLFLLRSIDLVGREGKRPRWEERGEAPGLLYINSKCSPDTLWRTHQKMLYCATSRVDILCKKLSSSRFKCQTKFVFVSYMLIHSVHLSLISLWSLLNPVRSNWSNELNSPNIGGFYFLSNTDDRYYISGYIHLLNFPLQIFKSEQIIVCTFRAPKICTY